MPFGRARSSPEFASAWSISSNSSWQNLRIRNSNWKNRTPLANTYRNLCRIETNFNFIVPLLGCVIPTKGCTLA
eukprot:90208-Amphidinium_carterae.1